jgi:putative tryptophan/tyrosine transport system substrate-binding protein
MVLLGGVLSWPLVAGAQQKAMPEIGWLSSGSLQSDEFRLVAFRQGLNESGYIEA